MKGRWLRLPAPLTNSSRVNASRYSGKDGASPQEEKRYLILPDEF